MRASIVETKLELAVLLLCGLAACGSPGEPTTLRPGVSVVSGDAQAAPTGSNLQAYQVQVVGADAQPEAGVTVTWAVESGGGSVNPASSLSDAAGIAQTTATLGSAPGIQEVSATVPGHAGSPVLFQSRGLGPGFSVLGGGGNVPERYTSDLWMADGYGYTGTWGNRPAAGNVLKIWGLDLAGAPSLVDSIVTPGIGTVSDDQVSPDGHWLMFTGERGTATANGIYVYQLVAPGQPVFRAHMAAAEGLHTGTLAEIGGILYAFAAKNPPNPAMIVYDLSGASGGTVTPVSTTPVPANYGIHDTVVRDGICFAFVWNEGVYIYDVGNGIAGGTPSTPVRLSTLAIPGGQAHNGWWFWNQATREHRYLFIGQEMPGTVGVSSSGSIYVADVSDLRHPTVVASFAEPGAGTHNFWVDEQRQVLYAAYYNAGVVALDVSGDLTGDLYPLRQLASIREGGANTYTWGVMLYNGSLYASDMLSGMWQLAVP
jgi:hypothetical protein